MNPTIFIVCIFLLLRASALGSGPKELWSGRSPAFSPDASYIAYIAGGRLVLKDLKSKKTRTLSNLSYPGKPRWSPDGRKLIFESRGPWNHQTSCTIWMIDLDGRNEHQVIEPTLESNHTPCFSSDGSRIVWSRGRRLWFADSGGREAQPLTKEPGKMNQWVCGWSPDGTKIAFVANADYAGSDQYRLWLYDVKDRTEIVLLKHNFIAQARWSRDGQRLFVTDVLGVDAIDARSGDSRGSLCSSDGVDSWYFDVSRDESLVAYERSEPESDTMICLVRLGMPQR